MGNTGSSDREENTGGTSDGVHCAVATLVSTLHISSFFIIKIPSETLNKALARTSFCLVT